MSAPETFGLGNPYGDPNWYNGAYHSAYYKETHKAWRKRCRAFVDEHIIPFVSQWEVNKAVPKETYIQCAEAGLLPIVVGAHSGAFDLVPYDAPEDLDYFHELIFVDELARCGSGGVLWGLIEGLQIGLPPVLNFGSDEMKKRVAPDCLMGKKIISLNITEPNAGSDVAAIKTVAKKDGDFYIVDGNKKWITNGIFSDYFTCAVRTGGPGMRGVSMLLLEKGPGIYNFVLNKRDGRRKLKPKLKNQDGGMDGETDQRSEASSTTAASSAECASTDLPVAGLTAGPQLPAPVMITVDAQGNPIQLPLMTPQLLPLTGGTQPALVFFLGPSGMVPSGDSPLVSNASSNAPLGNAVYFTQPVTLNVIPQDASLNGGVIEKALELAQFQSNPEQSDPQLPSQNITTELIISEGNSSIPSNITSSNLQGSFPIDHSFGSMPNISQNVVITQSVAAGESVPIENVSESVTVKTSQIMQNQGLFDLRPILDETRAQLADSADTSTETAPENFADDVPKLVYRKKVLQIREVMTQTGGESEVYIVSERKLDCEEDTPVDGPLENENTDSNSKKPARVKQFGCDKCEKKFYTNNLLRRHQTSHQEARPFSCEECQKGFRTSNELTIHKAIHVEVKQYKCEFCGKEFRTKGCIKSHIKYHIGDKRHKCTDCGRAFVKSADLKRHMAGHRNEKKFVCEDCGSAFTRRDNLKAHRLLHTRESVVTCDLCSKEFINAVYLKRHMHIHKQAKKKPYECQWCPKTYEQLEGLRRHIRQHVGDEKFVCKDCGKKFITSIQLKRHLWLSHDQDSPYRRSIL